jgi:hypothetical protein
MCVHNTFFLISNLVYTLIIESANILCVVSHCVFLKINNEQIPHGRGARLCQIGPIGVRPALHPDMLLRK